MSSFFKTRTPSFGGKLLTSAKNSSDKSRYPAFNPAAEKMSITWSEARPWKQSGGRRHLVLSYHGQPGSSLAEQHGPVWEETTFISDSNRLLNAARTGNDLESWVTVLGVVLCHSPA